MKLITKLLLCIIIIIVIFFVFIHIKQHIHISSYDMLISPQEAKSRRFGLILDVRTLQERELYGGYPNSIIIPFEDLTNQSISDLVSKDTSILIYCNKGNRAKNASVMLKSWGFKNVKYINQPYNSMMPPNTNLGNM